MAVFLNCQSTFYTNISSCAENIAVNLGLDPEITYQWVLTSPLGNVYKGHGTPTIEDQEFLIPASLFPPGFLNPWAGTFQLQFFAEDDMCEPTLFEVCNATYDAVAIRVYNMQDPEPTVRLACVC